ncbi:DUF2155 domain-containing protein [Shimia sp. W99]
MKRFLTAMAICAPFVASAQEIVVETLEIEPQTFESLRQPLGDVTSETVVGAVVAEGALLRGLDKLTGDLVDFELQNGYSLNFGALRVDMAQCRHPEDNATGEAYAYLTILENNGEGASVFEGWMIASSPALNALDHPRYDVWVLRCKTSLADGND